MRIAELMALPPMPAGMPPSLSHAVTFASTPDACHPVLEAVEHEPPKLLKGDSIVDGIERLRRRGRELNADLHRIESAPFPSSHAKRRMREQIEQLAARGCPDVTMLIEHDREIAWPTQRVQSQVFAEQQMLLAFTEVPDTLALLAFVHKQALLSALSALVDAESDDAAALSVEARQQKEAELMSDLLAVERDESWFVWRGMDERQPVFHRSDINPLALLSLKLVTAHPTNGGGTSPGHAYDIVMTGAAMNTRCASAPISR